MVPNSMRDAAAGGPRIDDKVYFQAGGNTNLSPATDNATDDKFLPSQCVPSSTITAGTGIDIEDSKGGVNIDSCVNAMVLLIDIRWQHYAANMVSYTNGGDFALDAANLGLTGASSLAPVGTAHILSAIATGLSGAKTAFNSDVLQQHAITAVVHEMVADRKEVYSEIFARLDARPDNATPPAGQAPAQAAARPYQSMAEAAVDLYAYAEAGSWEHALAAMETGTAAKADACTKQVRTQKLKSATGKADKTPAAAPTADCSTPPPDKAPPPPPPPKAKALTPPAHPKKKPPQVDKNKTG
jgi:hypothetical protein